MPSVPARRADKGFAARSVSTPPVQAGHFQTGFDATQTRSEIQLDVEVTRSRTTTLTPANVPLPGRPRIEIERTVEQSDERSNQGHRMRQPPPQPIGIPDQGVERQGCDDNKERIAPDQHVSAPRARVPRRGDRALPTASGRRIRSAFPGSQGALMPDKSAPAPDAA